MSRGIKALVIILIVLVGVLAGTSGFFYAKSVNLSKDNAATPVIETEGSSAVTTADTTQKTDNPVIASSSVTEASLVANRPSAPTDTHTVATGETMSIIAGKLDLNWLELAEANGLSSDDANKIKIGQVLLVPKNNQISFTVNSVKAKEIQTKVDGGKETFRLSAADTAKSDSPTAYGLAVTDTFTQKTIDNTAGTATVIGVHNGKNYEIKLTQPVTKGAKGIWAIASIRLTN